MIRRSAVAIVLFGVAFAAGRWVAATQPDQAEVARLSDRGGRATLIEPAPAPPRDAAPSRRPAGRIIPLRRAASGPSPWIAHVTRDPTHHAPDANRISQAVFSNEEIVTALDACTALFGRIESRLRLRTSITISSDEIEIGPVENIEVSEGELTSDARACVMAAFNRATHTTPAHPDFVQPYHGPYDLLASVVGDSPQATPGE